MINDAYGNQGPFQPQPFGQWTPPFPNPNGVNSGSLSGDMVKSAERVLALDEITARVAVTNENLSQLIMGTRELIDSLVGSEPEKSGSGSGPVPGPNGRVQGLSFATETTQNLVGVLRDQINRLRRL